MTLNHVWGALLIFTLCPLLGGLPLIDWIVRSLTQQKLSTIGTGNISVSAAFYHGGKLAGILAVLSEASKGIFSVLLARAFFPSGSPWEIVALIALVMGRYWFAKGAGTTNVFWGMMTHDWQATLLTTIIGGISFTIFRERTAGRLVVLVLLGILLSLRHFSIPGYLPMIWALIALMAGIFQKIPDDLELPEQLSNRESRQLFRFFRGENYLLSLDQPLKSIKVGGKAANLSQLKRWGYRVPSGWVLPPGDDVSGILAQFHPTPERPLVVRSSAIGEDSSTVSAAGQYTSVLNVISREQLRDAILTCQTSYNQPAAVQYRQDRQQQEIAIAVLIQKQIKGVVSGVAFSRDPVNPSNQTVVIEALPGEATKVVSGQMTPQRFSVIPETDIIQSPTAETDIPDFLIHQVAQIARELENRFQGIPQDIEWTYDGQQLWLLQSRPITNLQPMWTRKIAAEVIPGTICPLTWSINRPLTCGVWGEIFTLVLGERAADLDFSETATLHWQHAYFNASLLGDIFLRMGLPQESLEFLTRGSKFTRPPMTATLRNLPGLWRLWRRERRLPQDFARDEHRYFTPLLQRLTDNSTASLSPGELLSQIEEILQTLRPATYYSILAPLSFALRRAIGKVPPEKLDNAQLPEVASLQALEAIASHIQAQLSQEQRQQLTQQSLLDVSANYPLAQTTQASFQQWIKQYGYLSEVGTDIAIPRWRDDPQPMQALLLQLCKRDRRSNNQASQKTSKKYPALQQRLNLKGKATQIYSQLLAHLRWHFIALETQWLKHDILQESGDIFFLEYNEIEQIVRHPKTNLIQSLPEQLQHRKRQFNKNQGLEQVPYIAYGYPQSAEFFAVSHLEATQQLQGIAASPGQVEGRVKIIKTLQAQIEIEPDTILVVPYTDAGWSPLLAQAAGLIAEVGGSLSHGAIVAREYGIPAVMDIHHATQLLRDGQRIRLNGEKGIVEVLD